MDFELLLQQVLRGEWFSSALAVWMTVWGVLFIPVAWLMLMIPVYIKTRSSIVVSVLTLIFASTVIAATPPELHGVAYAMIVVSIASLLARLIIRW